MLWDTKRAIVFGGSAGSMKVVTLLLKALPADFSIPLLMTLHRPADKSSNIQNLFQEQCAVPIIEPTENVEIENGKVYLAPAGLHMVVEKGFLVNINNGPMVQYSRPSIDVLFASAAEVYKENLIGILVTGSNEDGANGMKNIHIKGGITIVQDPQDATIPRMPKAALEKTKIDHVLKAERIVEMVIKYHHLYKPKKR